MRAPFRPTSLTRVVWLLLALVWSSVAAGAAPRATDGVLDLSSWDFVRDGTVALHGQWSMWYGQRIEATSIDTAPKGTPTEVPGVWRGAAGPDGPLPGDGVATYHLRVKLPDELVGKQLSLAMTNTRATRLWIDNAHVAEWGDVTPDESVPGSGSVVWKFDVYERNVDIVAHVANHHHRVGGLRRSISLGLPADVARNDRFTLVSEVLMLVSLAVAGGMHVGVWVLRRKEWPQLWFGVVCLLQTLRMGSDRAAYVIDVEGMWWLLALKVEYISLYLTVAAGVLMMRALYPKESTPLLKAAALLVSGAFAVFVLVTPPWLYTHSLTPFQVSASLLLAWTMWDLTQAYRAGRPLAGLVLGCLAGFGLCVVHDVARAQDLPNLHVDLMYPGLLALLFAQIYILGRQYADSFTRVERLSVNLQETHRDLEETHRAVERFVPYEFLDLLERGNIREIRRGDHVSMQMGVLFCDLRGFTTTLEKMSPDDAFNFINRWLLRMEAPIHEQSGFINAYLGDAIMALFPGGADSALAASSAMLEGLEAFNAEQRARGLEPVRVGVGIHVGPLMLGTIGGESRIDCNVIGDAVNLASRIEGMTKLYGASVIISETVAQGSASELRPLGLVIAKGRSEPIAIYEVLDALPDDERNAKMASRDDFGAAMEAYRRGELDDSLARFQAILDAYPSDRAAQVYVERCQRYLREGKPEPWDGVTRLDQK